MEQQLVSYLFKRADVFLVIFFNFCCLVVDEYDAANYGVNL